MRTAAGARRGRLLLGLLVALAACSSDGTSRDGGEDARDRSEPEVVHRVEVDPQAVHPPGSEVADDIVVAEGSSQIGPTFPLLAYVQDLDTWVAAGWQAVFVVDDDPIAVWEAYVAQFDLEDEASATQACTAVRRGTPQLVSQDSPLWGNGYPHRFLTEEALEGEDRLECFASFGGVELTMAVGQDGCGAVSGDEIPDECREHEIAHLLVRVSTDEDLRNLFSIDGSLGTDELAYERSYLLTGDEGESIPIPTGPIVPPQIGEPEPSRLPQPGERIDDGLDYFLDDGDSASGGALAVPADARSLVAPGMVVTCNSGLVAVLSMPSEPTVAIEELEVDEPDDRPAVDDADEPAWAARFISTAGGFYLDMIAVPQPGGGSAVLVIECGD